MPAKDHYPYVTRSLVRLFESGRLDQVKSILVESDYGYVSRITYRAGNHRVTFGNDLGLNTGAASELAKDKGYTKFLLRALDVATPTGREFILPNWQQRIAETYLSKGYNNLRLSAEAADYVKDQLSYPVYAKPVSGSKGADVYRVNSEAELHQVLRLFDDKLVRLAVVEERIPYPDYRLVTLDGELVSAYRRVPLQVEGDGRSNVLALVRNLQDGFVRQGRDTRIRTDSPQFLRGLEIMGVDPNSVPARGEYLVLAPVSNLSVGGTSVDFTSRVAPRWRDLAASVAASFNLRLCGLDLACEDIEAGEGSYSVLEVNAAPGLDHYAMSGEQQREAVDDLYVRVLNTP